MARAEEERESKVSFWDFVPFIGDIWGGELNAGEDEILRQEREIQALADPLLAGRDPYADATLGTAQLARWRGAIDRVASQLEERTRADLEVDREARHPLVDLRALLAERAGDRRHVAAVRVEQRHDGYNYDRARIIAGIVQRATRNKLPAVSIIGLRQPIESDQALTGELTVLDLTIEDEARAQSALTMLRDTLESGDEEIRVSKEPLALRKLRTFFALMHGVTSALGSS